MPKKKKKQAQRRLDRYNLRQEAAAREVKKDQVLEDLRGLELGDDELAVLKALGQETPAEADDETGDVDKGDDDEVRDPEEPEEIHKDYGTAEQPAFVQVVGPTSFDELETARDAEDKAYEIRMAGWDVQDLVRNIIRHPEMAPADKSKAIKKVGTDFESRVSDLVSGPVKKDMDVLTVEAILARDRRRMGPGEKLIELIAKARPVSDESLAKMPDGNFAIVVDGTRKYPIYDRTNVRQSLALVSQVISNGGEESVAEARAALPKIRAASKKMGVEVSMEKDRNAILVEKDQSGHWRWVGWASNNFVDWSGEVLSKESHEDYIAWLDKNKDLAPLLMSWHTPGTAREAPADFWMYENGFLILSGPLTEAEAAGLLKAQAETDLGMSVGGFAIADKATPKVFKKYRLYEVSDLPLENADNPFTDFTVIAKEADMDKAKYLATLIGEERATEFLEKTAMKEEALKDAGVTQKEKTPETTAAPEKKTPAAKPKVLTPEMQAILKAVEEHLEIEGLNEFVAQSKEAMEKVEVLEELVKAASKSNEDALAEMIEPRLAWSKTVKKERPTAKAETEVPDGDELAAAVPGLGDNWLSKATGTTPVDVDKVPA